jgi:pyruvate dehydrogenase E2 component (dihydrolipoamide acetyltransferase)
MTDKITPLVMPKWGLEMREGTVAGWLVDEGTRLAVGTPVVDVETDKISNTMEAPNAGLLRRRVAAEGATLPVKALLGVLAEADVPDADIDAFIAAYQVPAASEGDDDAGPAYTWVTVDGIRVRVLRRDPASGGKPGGVPVLLLHGFGGDLNNWLFNIDALAAKHAVIALDLPGHGASDVKLPGATLPVLAAFVARVLDQLDVERVHAVGHSMGGAIAAQLAADQPKRVASLALVCSAGLGDEIDGDYIRGFVDAPGRRELKPVVEKLFADPSLVTRQLLDDLLKYKRLDGVGELLEQLAAGLFAQGRQVRLPARAIDTKAVPTLVIWGEGDRIIPAAHAKHAPAGASVHVLPGAGHMVMMEKAGEVNALLLAHLGRA